VKQPWAWVAGLVVLVAASPVLLCLLRALIPAVVVIALAVVGIRVVFFWTSRY
jgi:hypothetical protein